MRKAGVSFLIVLLLLIPSISFAAGLTSLQATAILGLLEAFGADSTVIAQVSAALGVKPANSSTISTTSSSQSKVTPTARLSVIGSPFPSSGIGYDISYNTNAFPQMPFGFVVIGATAGKAFSYNSHMPYEFSLGKTGSAVAPGIYMNLNGPYGSSAATSTMSTPKQCALLFGAPMTSDSTGGTYPEPTLCAGYNYGFNAAKSAFAYTSSLSYVSSTLWWLDIEEINSWSPNTAVNDAVIQGALDYLNAQGIRVGIYSVPFMWNDIAGVGFTPIESLYGVATSVPTWFPIGTSTQVGALNSCLDHTSFIPGSPVWVIQYELDTTSADQNIAC
ncbi:MAG TPA: hypothetical protein VNF51_02150 [Candidatus Paceibacterota bacterium]|nr:hypothetical protein [Candidatus Paceibacterota bacterium]